MIDRHPPSPGKLLGWPLDVTGPAYEQFVQSLCAVEFRPVGKGD